MNYRQGKDTDEKGHKKDSVKKGLYNKQEQYKQ